MSDHITRSLHDEESTSPISSRAHQSSWMSHWMRKGLKPSPRARNSSITCHDDGYVDKKSSQVRCELMMEDGLHNFGKGISKEAEAIISENPTKEVRGSPSFRGSPSLTLSLCQNSENSSLLRTQIGQELGHKNFSIPLAVDKEDIVEDMDLPRKNNLLGREKHVVPHSYEEHADASGPLVVFEKHFSNDNFTCMGQGHGKYQKLSTILFHEKNDLSHESGKKNFLPFFLKKQSESDEGQPLDRVSRSVCNVETMRICTMVDSVANSPGGPPKIFSQRAHHFIFTKETCVNLFEGHQVIGESTVSPDVGSSHPRGVTIQPLCTSTDSEEKEYTVNPLTFKTNSENDACTAIDAMQIEAPKNWHTPSGVASSPRHKDDVVHENIAPTVAIDLSTEKTRSKRPISEIPDINEEAPEPEAEVSSTDSMDTSTSRVHSLNAKHLFPSDDQASDASNRWIKRLKISSTDTLGVGTKNSETGEASSREKFNVFFNRIMKCKASLEPMLSKHHNKEQMVFDQNMKSLRNSGSSSMVSKKRNQSMMMPGCSWIQRWRRGSTAPKLRNTEPLVICEPHSSKFGPDELAKKQFPSIAAMALMGKAMNGFRPCEFRKRGPVVVWNTQDY